MLLDIASCLLFLVAPLMVTLEAFGGYQFTAWDYVAPVAFSTSLFVCAMVRAREQDLRGEGESNG